MSAQHSEKPPGLCPQCKNTFDHSASKAYPFCSERCRLLDLGAWASERYIIKGKPLDDVAEAKQNSDESDENANS